MNKVIAVLILIIVFLLAIVADMISSTYEVEDNPLGHKSVIMEGYTKIG